MSQILKLTHENQQLKRQINQYQQVLGVSPYVNDSLFKGGYRVVKTITDRDKIDCCHRKLGMKVLVIGDDLSFKEYVLKTDDCKKNIWEEVDITVEENEVFLIEDYSELSENLTTQKELNLILKQLILNLQTNLDNKLEKGTYTGTAQDLKNSIDSKANISHTHDISSINNLQTSLDTINNDINNLEGINYVWSPTDRTLTLFDNNGNQLSQVSLVSLDNEGTDLRYNASTLSLELYNADNELLDSIPVSSFIGSVGTQLQLNSNQLQLKDSQGNILSTVSFTVSNIDGLQDFLDNELNNYYTKSETYSKIEINNLLDSIEVTKTQLDVLISENKLEPNRLYKITGVESWCFSQHLIKAIYLKAITNNTLESEGVGEFYTPKYNELDSNLGIWKGELFANGMIDSLNYNIGDKVLWGNLFWENISGNIGTNGKEYYDEENDEYFFVKFQNFISETDWKLITPNDDISLYNIQFDSIKYDLENDYVNYRADNLGNIYELSYNILLELNIINLDPTFIYYLNGIALFQWSNDYFQNNKISDSLVINCNYKHVFKSNFIIEKSIINDNNFFNIDFIGNVFKKSKAIANYLKNYGGIINNTLYDSQIAGNRYYIQISNNKLINSSQINNNNDNNIIVNSKYTIIKDNVLDNNCRISFNTFIEEGKEVDYNIKSIKGNELINNCSINYNTIKNGSKIMDHNLSYFSTINGNTLDTEANIYNNQVVQQSKIDNNILTGHGRIFRNQLDDKSEITLCKLRIYPTTSYSSGIHSSRLFKGKIQNVDFGNIVNPEGTNPNDPNFGGNVLTDCIIENGSIIKDLTFPNIGNKYIQFIKMNGFSEFKNITVNDSIRNVDFINTIFNETSDYSKLIEGSGLQTNGFTKTYIDGVLLQDKFDEKQNNLGYTPENISNKSDSYTASSSTTYASTKALVDGLATKSDLVDGKVPSSQLPSYVDDVLEFANLASFPATGESGKIYIAIDTNLTYRWGGSSYVVMSSSLALGETASTAYRGDRGKIAYDHSQINGNPHGTTKADIGLGNVDNTSDLDKPISTATQNALVDGLATKLNKGSYTGTAQNLKDDIDNIQIGGRNLFGFNKGINFGINDIDKSINGYVCNYTSFNVVGRIYNLGFEGIGGDFTVSMYIKANKNVGVNVNLCDISTSNSNVALTTEYVKQIFYFKNVYQYTDSTYFGFLDIECSDLSAKVFVKDLKIERGNKATDWTPAPEDKQDRLQDITGNIGVGKPDASATEKLDVNGYVKASGFKTTSGTSSQYVRGDGTLATFPNIPQGTVTSVAMTVPTGLSVTGSPITSSGTLALSYSTGYQGYTTTEATKLAGIAAGADNYGSWNLKTNGVQRTTITSGGTLDLVAGNNVNLSYSAGGVITINSTDTIYTHPTTAGNKHIPAGGVAGQILRWSADGTAVWGADNDTTYTLPIASATVLGGVKIGTGISIDGNGVISANTSYTAGTNITISGNTISVNSSPTFSGSVTATSFFESSLRKYKTNIKKFDKSGIDLVNSLEIVTFDRIDSYVKSKIGIIADDTSDEFLSEQKDAIDLYKTIFIQAKAIQELNAKNLELEERLIKLEKLLSNG